MRNVLLLQLFISPKRRAYIFRVFFIYNNDYKMKLLDSKIIGKKTVNPSILICGSPGGRLVTVAASSGVVAGRTARTAAASAAASSEAPASTVAAGSPAAIAAAAAAAAVVLRPTAAVMAEARIASSHFPVRTAVG
jgi:hypothetical protein